MPHLSPLNWILMFFYFWSALMTLIFTLWWNKTYINELTFPTSQTKFINLPWYPMHDNTISLSFSWL